ncbi:hypothetical protein [Microbacterium aurum]
MSLLTSSVQPTRSVPPVFTITWRAWVDLLAGARGVLLAEAGLQSSTEGRKIELPALSLN